VAAGATSQGDDHGPLGLHRIIYVGGDGTIVNRLATTGASMGSGPAGSAMRPIWAPNWPVSQPGQCRQRDAVHRHLRQFGHHRFGRLNGNAVKLSTTRALLSATAAPSSTAARRRRLSDGTTTGNSTIANSGTITGGMLAYLTAPADAAISISNSGTITGYTLATYTFDPHRRLQPDVIHPALTVRPAAARA
jgi:hypothetical protein